MYQGGYLAFAVICALAINGVMAARSGPVSRVLSVPPLPWIGRISYGLYLWHWLVDVWVTPQYLQASFAVTFFVRLAVTFAIASASYYLVERPIRTAGWSRLRTPRLATLAGFGAALVLAFLATGWGTRMRVVAQAAGPTTPPAPTLPTDLRVLVAGDSVGFSIGYGVPKPAGLRLSTAAIIGCGVLPGDLYADGVAVTQTGVVPCNTARQYLDHALTSKPDVVVLTFGAWEVFEHMVDGRPVPFYSARYRNMLATTLGSELDDITAHSTARVVVLDAPCMHQANFALGDASSPRNDPRRVALINSVLHEVVAQRASRVSVLPWSKWLCPGGHYLERRQGIVVRPDGVHLSLSSAVLLWKWLGPQLRAMAAHPGVVPATR